MVYDPQSPVTSDGQLSARALDYMAEQSALAQATRIGSGCYEIQTGQATLVVPSVSLIGDVLPPPVNLQTGTTYTLVGGTEYGVSDFARLVSIGNAAPQTITLPQPGGPFFNGWWCQIECTGAGALTLTPVQSTIDAGLATLAIPADQGVVLYTDGVNWYTVRGLQPTSSLFGLTITNNPANGQVLEFVSGSPNTLQWVTPGGSGVNLVCIAQLNADQSIPDATPTAAIWGAPGEDTGPFWDAGTPTEFTIPSTGVYQINCTIVWDKNASGDRFVAIAHSSNAVTCGSAVPSTILYCMQSVTGMLAAGAGDTVTVQVYQNSGGALNIKKAQFPNPFSGINADSWFSIAWLAPG